MEKKIAECLEKVCQELEAVRREKKAYELKVTHYWTHGISESELEAWADDHFGRLLQKERELAEEKRKLQNHAESAKREDLHYLVQAATHRFR